MQLEVKFMGKCSSDESSTVLMAASVIHTWLTGCYWVLAEELIPLFLSPLLLAMCD